ncbi:hypothetical protein COLO4_15827 [Corchorus olitorius]|uniref:Uncharacterized protein n=1 Tax=Corchorus olitorius TaxID=93759 RepID=A0A1R3JKW8_9ROSI|nr:hypothetical protein COLO4_15827 [Corchorus olitorius]
MKEDDSNSDELFFDFINSILSTATPLPEEPEVQSVQSFPANQNDEIMGTKKCEPDTSLKPGKIAAYWLEGSQPWLKQKPSTSSYQENSDNVAVKQEPKLEPIEMNEEEPSSAKVYQKVIEGVTNKTRQAFLENYGDDSVLVKLQEQQPRRPWLLPNAGFKEEQPEPKPWRQIQVSSVKNSSNEVHAETSFQQLKNSATVNFISSTVKSETKENLPQIWKWNGIV